MGRVTVRDVAKDAGVCLATVDRVLNNRKGVSEAMRAKVAAAIDRLGFKRDVFAVSLATSREYRFAFVLPSATPNSFLAALRREVELAADRLAQQRITVSLTDYQRFDERALVAALKRIPPECMGVAVVAVDAPPVREAINALAERGVGVVTLVSDVTPSQRVHCVGIDNIAAGRVAGSLMGRFVGGRVGKVALIAGSMILRDHADRRLGFKQVVLREFPQVEVLPVIEGRGDSAVTAEAARGLLSRYPDLIGIYSIGAGDAGIVAALEASGRHDQVVVVSHELTPTNRQALASGTFDAVLCQKPADEVETAARTLKAFCDGDRAFCPPAIGIDIFVRDNLP